MPMYSGGMDATSNCVLRWAVSRVLLEQGFSEAEGPALELVVARVLEYIGELGERIAARAAHEQRARPTVRDVLGSIDALPQANIEGKHAEGKMAVLTHENKPEDVYVAESSQFDEPAAPPRPAYVPEDFIPFPGYHTYKHTPTYTPRPRNPAETQARLLEQSRVAEKALRNLLEASASKEQSAPLVAESNSEELEYRRLCEELGI